MNKPEFERRFDKAHEQLMNLTERLCYNRLISPFKYMVFPSGNEIHDGMTTFDIEEHSRMSEHIGILLNKKKVIDLLFKDDKCPKWIDMWVYESRHNLTVIKMMCSRRRRSKDELTEWDRHPPFHPVVLNPYPEPVGKWDVNLKKKQDDDRRRKNRWNRIKALFRFKA